LDASVQLEHLDEETLSEPFRKGIHTLAPIEPAIDPETMALKVQEVVTHALSLGGKKVCTLGGDHSVSIGAIRAFYNTFGPMNIVQFDAHLDLRESYQGSRYSHACVMRRVWDLGRVIQVGIRSFSREELDFLQKEGRRPILAKEIHQDQGSCVKRLVKSLDPGLPTYVTLDLDVLDPSIMPGVGTPEPGGMDWYGILDFIRAIPRTTRVIGFDCVELSPVPGMNISEYTAARLVYKFIAYVEDARRAWPDE